jgi:hypothetical protein
MPRISHPRRGRPGRPRLEHLSPPAVFLPPAGRAGPRGRRQRTPSALPAASGAAPPPARANFPRRTHRVCIDPRPRAATASARFLRARRAAPRAAARQRRPRPPRSPRRAAPGAPTPPLKMYKSAAVYMPLLSNTELICAAPHAPRALCVPTVTAQARAAAPRRTPPRRPPRPPRPTPPPRSGARGPSSLLSPRSPNRMYCAPAARGSRVSSLSPPSRRLRPTTARAPDAPAPAPRGPRPILPLRTPPRRPGHAPAAAAPARHPPGGRGGAGPAALSPTCTPRANPSLPHRRCPGPRPAAAAVT